MEQSKKTVALVECAVLVAMAFVLSFVKIIDMPFGGSVTAASMLPIIIAGYRHGLKWGILSGFTYSVLQLIMGMSNVSYATSAAAAAAIIILDYIVAFTVLGLPGIFKRNKKQIPVLVFGTLVVCLLRFICHFITGCTVWAGVSIPTSDGAVYSIIYNAAYMIPETIVTVYMAGFLSSIIDFRSDRLVTRKRTSNAMSVINGALVFGISIIIDFLYLFKQIQTEDGFDVTLIWNSNLGIIAAVTGAGLIIGIIIYFVTKTVTSKQN